MERIIDRIEENENNKDILELSYEEAVCELEAILNKMDRGELPLDASMKNFERGMNLIAYCEKILGSYERKITKILETKNGELKEIEIKA
jgi:exodeoxyribonuclease VII small subunit